MLEWLGYPLKCFAVLIIFLAPCIFMVWQLYELRTSSEFRERRRRKTIGNLEERFKRFRVPRELCELWAGLGSSDLGMIERILQWHRNDFTLVDSMVVRVQETQFTSVASTIAYAVQVGELQGVIVRLRPDARRNPAVQHKRCKEWLTKELEKESP